MSSTRRHDQTVRHPMAIDDHAGLRGVYAALREDDGNLMVS